MRQLQIQRITKYLRRPRVLLSIFSVTAFLLCFNLFLTYKIVNIDNNIDGGWQYALSSLRHSEQKAGVDVFFNYGPLFTRSASYVTGQDNLRVFVLSNLLLGLIVVLCSLGIVTFIRHWVPPGSKKAIAYVMLVTAYVTLTVNQPDTVFFVVMLVGLLACRREKRWWLQLLILFGLQLFSLYKFNYTIMLAGLSPFVFITGFRRKQLLDALWRWLLFVGSYFAAYVLVTWSWSAGFFKYFYYGTINAIYYNEFMSLPFEVNRHIVVYFSIVLVIVLIPLLVLLARLILVKKNKALSLDALICYALVMAVTFIIFKEAVVRSDGHLMAFMPVLFLPLVAIVLLTEQRNLLGKQVANFMHAAPLLGLVLVSMFFVGSLFWHSFVTSKFTPFRPTQVLSHQIDTLRHTASSNRLNYSYYNWTVQMTRTDLRKYAPEVATINTQLENLKGSNKKILFYGNTAMLGQLLDKEYKVLYAPFLQNYSAHPPQLFDHLYIDFLKKNPDSLVFVEESEGSINERIPGHELNEFFQYLAHNYQVVAADKTHRQSILQRTSDKPETCKLREATKSRKGKLITVPKLQLQDKQYVKMSMTFPFSPREELLGLAVKKPVYTLQLITPHNASSNTRTTQTTLEHGVAISPLHTSFYDAVYDAPFDLKGVKLYGGLDPNTPLDVRFEVCTF